MKTRMTKRTNETASFAARRSVLGAAVLGALLAAPAADAAREAKMYAVTVWNAGCSGSTRNTWDDMVDAWYDEITDTGFSMFGICWWGHCGEAYSRDGRYINGNMVNSRFADTSKVNWGNDNAHLDEGDAVMIGTHGWDSAGTWGGTMRVDEPGGGNCNLMGSEMDLGDLDLEFLHLSSCNSMDRNQWGSWNQAADGVHQIDGFHGFMWIGPSLISNYEDFADDAFDGSIASAWLDAHYVPNVSGSDDQCPVAWATASSGGDALNRLLSERYDHVFSDPSSAGGWAATYIGGCDPANESVL